MRTITFFLLIVAGLSCLNGPAYAAEAQQPDVLMIEMRVYQVLTNITGLTGSVMEEVGVSRTMPGDEGSCQILNLKLDDVRLHMAGETLEWDGKPLPSHHKIRPLANPQVRALVGQEVGIHVGTDEPVSFLVRREDGLFELKTLDAKESSRLGFSTSFTVTRGAEDSVGPVLEIDMNLSYIWIRDREKIEGVDLNVGKPKLDTKSLDCFFGARPNEWVCYRTAIRSQGYIFLFMRIADGRIPVNDIKTDDKDTQS